MASPSKAGNKSKVLDYGLYTDEDRNGWNKSDDEKEEESPNRGCVPRSYCTSGKCLNCGKRPPAYQCTGCKNVWWCSSECRDKGRRSLQQHTSSGQCGWMQKFYRLHIVD